jgi:tagaturonate epimerase
MTDLFTLLQKHFAAHIELDVEALKQKLPTVAMAWNESKDKADQVKFYPRSAQIAQNSLFFMVRWRQVHWLLILGEREVLSSFEGAQNSFGKRFLGIFPLKTKNADALRQCFSWLKPKPYGLATTFGCGDRLGLATPGHIRAARSCGVNVLLAQQSIREMARTVRTPQEVMDDAMWGVFQEGYSQGFGSDADHLKTFQDIENTAAVGFTMFTIDPSENVDRAADNASENELDEKLKTIDSKELPVNVAELTQIYQGKTFDIPGLNKITPSALDIKRAIVKYGKAVAHTEKMARHIEKVLAGKPYDLEMSVDETDNPTTPIEHLFVGLELKRRNIKVHSLALRFIGEFQKGIDYIGDLKAFEESFKVQFAIAKHCGPYKMSIHSGSDKFSIFPIIGKVAGTLVHEKTAGTSYLEALRAVARVEPHFFRDICSYAIERYPTDRATYHVAEKLDHLPDIKNLPDADLEKLFDNDQGRQLLHVTFGSVLNEKEKNGSYRFKDKVFKTLRENEELYSELLDGHFTRHMQSLGMAKSEAKPEVKKEKALATR